MICEQCNSEKFHKYNEIIVYVSGKFLKKDVFQCNNCGHLQIEKEINK
jgi:hypothetical protein